MDWGLISFAFMAGMVAFLAPCSFPMLPSYIAYFIGMKEEEKTEDNGREKFRRGVLRGLYFGGLTTLGFVAFFGIIGLALYPVTPIIRQYIPVISGIVAVALVILGVMILLEIDPYMTLPVKAPKNRGGMNFFLFGLLYSAASLACSLPIFISVILAAFARSGAAGSIMILLVYAGGMGALMIPISVASSLSKEVLIMKLRAALPLIKKAGAVIILLMGLYIMFVDVLAV